MKWLDGITDGVDMNLGKLQEMVRESREWQPTPVFLPGESQGWGHTESYMTEVT